MADTLSRLVGPANIANGTSTIATVPGATTWSIKSIRILNTTGAAITVLLGIGGVAAANQILPSVSIGAGEWAEYDGLITMTAAETLQATTSATGLTITVSGLSQA